MPDDAIPPVPKTDPLAQSADLVAENLAALRGLFPQAFAEGRVDFDVLRELLGNAVEEGEERYGLSWSGKARARRHALTPTLATLRPAPEDSVDWDTTRNVVVEGDNLEVLKCLAKSYAGKVKLIYIDPPYNTGNDFVYPDDYAEPLRNYLHRTGQANGKGVRNTSNPEASGRFHTDWLNMIYPRLILARELLGKDGVIFISIDDTEAPHVRLACDIIFGEENFISEIVWESAGKNDARQIGVNHEYVILYARDRSSVVREWSIAKIGVELVLREAERLRKAFGEDYDAASEAMAGWFRASKSKPAFAHRRYRFLDKNGLYKEENRTAPGGRKFDLINPMTDETINLTRGRGWGFDQHDFNQMVADGRITFYSSTSIMVRKYLHETLVMTPQSVFYQPTRSASERLSKMMGISVFDFPKDETVLQQFVEMASTSHDLILDFFAGSGTTGHAVMAQNAADGGSRRFILVQLPEPLDPANKDQRAAADFCDTHGLPRTIAELTKERLRRAGDKVQAEHPEAQIDTGFRVYKLASSNLKVWQPGEDSEASLLDAADNLVPGRTEDDLLVELLLKRGIDLCEPVQTQDIGGKRVHAFGGGVLVVCLAPMVDAEAEALASGIADWVTELDPVAPALMFFRDTGFESDVGKLNLEAILRQRLHDRGPGLPPLLEPNGVRSV